MVYTKFQKYVPFGTGSKSPLSPLFPKGGTRDTDRYVVAITKLMGLLASLRPPFLKGNRGIFSAACSPANRNIFMTMAILRGCLIFMDLGNRKFKNLGTLGNLVRLRRIRYFLW